MKAASINEIKQELKDLSPARLLDVCLRLAKYKKENKELITYLLFEAGDEGAYIRQIKEEIDQTFDSSNLTNFYLAKKSVRKLLRITKKYIKYSGLKTTEAELLLYFCKKLKESGIKLQSSTALNNLYQAQLKKIREVVASLHEDLQYDYLNMLKKLE